MPTRDAALRWNRLHPVGTAVVVTLPGGRSAHDHTAGPALQWGSQALVTLASRPGLWSTTSLDPIGTGARILPMRGATAGERDRDAG